MSRISAILGFVFVIGCGQALAQNNPNSGQNSAKSPVCYNDQLINTNGQTLRMSSGQIFQGFPGSNPTLSFWLPLDKVKICRLRGSGYEITNLSRHNQIKALRRYT
jgi:hypothetical protein